MLRMTQIRLNQNEPAALLPEKIGKLLRIRDFRPLSWKIVRESVDARKKPEIRFIYTVDFSVENEEALLKKAEKIKGVDLKPAPDLEYVLPENRRGAGRPRPVVVGTGPCGLFAALTLAQAGARPLVLERGRDVEQRTRDVEHFWNTGELDPVSNVQYGEGGAGTFSDGKLTTGIKDVRIARVNQLFIEAGAHPSIAYAQLPHIGTDVLRQVVRRLREKIIALGGEVRFETRVTGIVTEPEAAGVGVGIGPAGEACSAETSKTAAAGSTDAGGTARRLTGLLLEDGETIACDTAVLAVGNSARDTFRMLSEAGVPLEAKPFSVGVRIEHPQAMVDTSQYGVQKNDAEGRLGAAAYKLSHHCSSGRGVYTFCMCPGGVVVGAASEPGGVVTNGMSYFARDGENANSALLVDVRPEDCGADRPGQELAGIRFQEELEKKAYELGGGGFLAPAQRLGDFMKNQKPSAGTPAPAGTQAVAPTYRPGVQWRDLSRCLPDFVTDSMREALPFMAKKLKGFDLADAVMTGVETRSSSPVRILRDRESLQSTGVSGLYPGGEGAGYAGGIMSAAVDGIRLAEKILETE